MKADEKLPAIRSDTLLEAQLDKGTQSSDARDLGTHRQAEQQFRPRRRSGTWGQVNPSTSAGLQGEGPSGTALAPTTDIGPASPVRVTHRWFGTVTSVEDDVFEARLYPATHGDAEVLADFEVADVLPGDRDLIAPGAAFYVSVGTLQTRMLTRTVAIRFQRLGPWHSDDIAFFRERGRKRRQALGFDELG
jgi:hypothetical protein